MNKTVTLEYDGKAILGEGPVWNGKENLLYWVDIESKIINTFNSETKKNTVYNIGKKVGAFVLTQNEDLILAAEDGFYKFNIKSNTLNLILKTEENPQNHRMNDGKCDPMGRFWAGSMTLEELESCNLYCLDIDYKLTKKESGIKISNGMAWGQDNNTMYYIDTPTKKVVAYDYDIDTAGITNKRTVIEIPDELGYPDGMTIDEEGKLWVALWSGSAISRWDPDTGKLLERIHIPAQNVSSCTFGGKNLDTLYITTARVGTSNDNIKKYPNAGGLFSIKPGVKGLQMPIFLG